MVKGLMREAFENVALKVSEVQFTVSEMGRQIKDCIKRCTEEAVMAKTDGEQGVSIDGIENPKQKKKLRHLFH